MTPPRHPWVVSMGLFTTLPMPAVATIDRGLAGRAMAWFPVVGLTLGVLSGVVAWAVGVLGGPLLGAGLGLAALAWLTGALHLDGLADTADGLGSRTPPEQALEIMRRSDVGPMGVISLVFVLLIDAAALARIMAEAMLAGAAALALAVVLGRVAVVCATTAASRGARTQGFGALFHGVTSTATAALWVVAGIGAAGGAGWALLGAVGAAGLGIAAVAALGAGWVWRRHLMHRLGGMTGDTFGSVIEVTQTVFLVAAALAVGAAPLI